MCELTIECFGGYLEDCGANMVRFDGLVVTKGDKVTRIRAPYRFEIIGDQVTITSVFPPDQYVPEASLTMTKPAQYTTTELLEMLNKCKCC